LVIWWWVGSGETRKNTYISFQILVSGVRFHADEVPEHARHDIFAEYDDFLAEEFETAGVARQVDLGDLGA
jgi:hypothetical protein